MQISDLREQLKMKTATELIEQLANEAQKEYEFMDRRAKEEPGSLYASYRFSASLANERATSLQLAVSILKAAETVADCHAELWHGPGHQSKATCRVKGLHGIHEAIYGSEIATWRGDVQYTGAFDEPPEED